MRSSVFLLAFGLLVADTALASPCKPKHSKHSTSRVTTTTSVASLIVLDTTTAQTTTTSDVTSSIVSTTLASSVAYETSTVTSSGTLIETTTSTSIADSETSTVSFETSVASATSTSIDDETSTSVPIGSPTESVTSTSIVDETTTVAATTTSATSSTITSTSTAPVATPTFTLVGGGGSVNGAPLQGIDQEGTLLIFNPQFGGLRVRTFVLDPETGRLRDKDTSVSVCAYYGYSTSTSVPAYIAFCQSGNTGQNSYYDYLTCQVASGKLTCTAPRASCTEDFDGETTCVTQPGNDVIDQFYYRTTQGSGDYLYISSGSPSGFTPVDILAPEA